MRMKASKQTALAFQGKLDDVLEDEGAEEGGKDGAEEGGKDGCARAASRPKIRANPLLRRSVPGGLKGKARKTQR